MRDNSVSIAKSFAIILMVLAHTCFLDIGEKWINMFHMPLFFFMAGYCFKDKYLTDFKSFANKRISGLYKPFVKWSMIFLFLHNIFFYLNIYNGEYGFMGKVSQLYTLTDFVKRATMILTSMSGNEQLLGGYWFLKSLFLGSFIAYFTIRYVKKPVLGGGGLVLIIILASAFGKSVPFIGISARDFFAALIFMTGYHYKSAKLCIHQSWWCVPIGVLLVTIGVIYWQASLLKFDWTQVVPYMISATAGTLMIFKLSSWIDHKDGSFKRIMVYIGNNTLTILTWHFFSFKLVSLVIIYCEDLPMERLAEFPVIIDYTSEGWFILYLLVGMAMPLVLTKTKYFK